MASDPRVNTPCGLEGPGQKVKIRNNFKNFFFLVFHYENNLGIKLACNHSKCLVLFVGHEQLDLLFMAQLRCPFTFTADLCMKMIL